MMKHFHYITQRREVIAPAASLLSKAVLLDNVLSAIAAAQELSDLLLKMDIHDNLAD